MNEKTLLKVERNAAMAARRARGDTFESIGADYGISKQAVQQILLTQPFDRSEVLALLEIEISRAERRLVFLMELKKRLSNGTEQ